MFKKFTLKGFAQGIVTGLVVTFLEGFFLLRSDTYIPLSYPLCLIAFNVLFWMSIGGLSGLILWIFSVKDDFLQKEEIYRVVFFLLPFALLYGVLGRLFIDISNSRPVVFDYHLSFVWVLGILIFKFYNTIKSTQAGDPSAGFFVFETATMVMLFQFCSNIRSVEIFNRFYSSQYHILKNITYAESFYYCIVYVVGVFFIVGLYFFTFRATTSLTKGKPLWRNYVSIGTLFLGVVIWLGSIYIWQQRDSVKGITSDSVSEQSPAAKNIPYVILIVLDTVRADRMSVYDNTGTTKHLEIFSRDALVFENCLASSPWTVPSHASLFTGLYPSEHGVHIDNTIKGEIWGWPQLIAKLANKFTTLAEIFLQNGYKTKAVVSNNILNYNLNQGFQHFDKRKSIGFVYNTHAFRPILHLFSYLTNIYPKHIIRYRTADDINKECFDFLERSRDAPFFLFINYLDAHGPYFPPRPFSGFGLKTAYPQLYKLKHLFFNKTGRLTPEQKASYNLLQYDGEIAFLDDQLGKLFSRLKKLNVYDSSLIIVTSDHGELFNENGMNGHRCAMYQGLVRVPLLIKYPFSGRVGRVKKMVPLTDLFTTILTACGLPLPDGIPGKTVDDIATPFVSEYFSTKSEFGEHRILYDGKYKYMKYEFNRVAELYNLSEDSMERENIVTTNPEIVEEMENKLKDWQNAHRPKQLNPSQQKVDLSQDAVQALKGLGYIQ